MLAANVVLGAAMAWAARRIDWLALGAHELERAGAMALALVLAAGLYFGVLALLGVPLRSLGRKA